MPDFVMVNGVPVQLPGECENDLAARAAFIAKALGEKPEPKAPTPAAAPEEK